MGRMASRFPRWASSTSRCSSSSSNCVAGSEATDTYSTPRNGPSLQVPRHARWPGAVVANFHELETVGRRGQPSPGAVLGRKDLGHLRRLPVAPPDLGQGPDQDPHHVPEKGISSDIYVEN